MIHLTSSLAEIRRILSSSSKEMHIGAASVTVSFLNISVPLFSSDRVALMKLCIRHLHNSYIRILCKPPQIVIERKCKEIDRERERERKREREKQTEIERVRYKVNRRIVTLSFEAWLKENILKVCCRCHLYYPPKMVYRLTER